MRVAIFTVCGTGLAIWLLSQGVLLAGRRITARAAISSDELDSSEVFPLDHFEFPHIRIIAVVEGAFTMRTGIDAALYFVRSGVVDKQSTRSGGRSNHQYPKPIWRHLRISLVIGESAQSGRRTTILGSYGAPAGGGTGPGAPHTIKVSVAQLVTGPLCDKKDCVLYVEGDRECLVEPDMTVEQFAERNPIGEFLVVTAGVH
jgi:hypothetical protein